MVAPVAGVATPLFGAVLAPVTPLRYVAASLSSGMVPNTRIRRELKKEISRRPAKRVLTLLLSVVRLRAFQSAGQKDQVRPVVTRYTAFAKMALEDGLTYCCSQS